MSRSPKLTPELIGQLALEIEEGSTRSEAAAACDISVTSLEDWLKVGRDPTGRSTLKRELALAITKADLLYCRSLRRTILKAGSNPNFGDWRALKFLLEHRLSNATGMKADELRLDKLTKEIHRLEIENERLVEEVEYKRLTNAALRSIHEKQEEPGDFLREALEIQSLDVDDEQVAAAYYEGLERHSIPSPQEDEAAINAEAEKAANPA